MDTSPKSSNFTEVCTPSTPDIPYQADSWQPKEHYSCLPGRMQTLLRSWMIMRWSLSRHIFSIPIPFLTTNFDVKKGDLVLTLPVVTILVIVNAILAGTRSVGGSGTIATLGLLLVFFFAIRNNVLLLEVTGISFERALFYHKVFAYTTSVLAALHGLSYLLAHRHGDEEDQTSKVVTGTITLGAMIMLFTTSLSCIRRQFFEFFLTIHWVLFLVVFIVGVAHGAALALVGIVPWIIDLVFRLVYRTRIYKQGSVFKKKGTENLNTGNGRGVIASDQVAVAVLPGNIIRVSFSRVRKDTGEVFEFEAGQYAFLCIPSISKLQWHPFSISSAPHEDTVVFYIRALGNWTNKVLEVAQKNDGTQFDILVDGPYGKVSVDIENPKTYSHFALFAGGIGVTPMRSILNELHYERYTLGRSEIKHVHFAWSLQNHDTLKALLDSTVQNDEESASVGYFPTKICRDDASAFHSEFYLMGNEQESGEVYQQFEQCLLYGTRPNITAILTSLGEQAKQDGTDRVAVLVCGPKSMVQTVLTTSLTLSKEMQVHFDVHTEFFEF